MASTAPAWWQRRRGWARLLYPVSLLFFLLSAIRRWSYRLGLLNAERLPVPVVIVGNIAVGGSGKTPVVKWLVDALRAAGWRPGVVSRGYGGRVDGVAVLDGDDAGLFGDEPVLLARLTGCPVAVGRDRPAAARALLEAHPECDIIVSDDGMQHYRLARDVEIAVVDDKVLGNRYLLPAGPLREPLTRLTGVDVVIAHGALSEPVWQMLAGTPVVPMRLAGDRFVSVTEPGRSCTAADFRGRRVHAVAGIGRPQRFFDQLRAMGLEVIEHPFPDHHCFSAADLAFVGEDVCLMTSKDAVKCRPFAPDDAWEFPVQAIIGSGAAERILEKLNNGRPTA